MALIRYIACQLCEIYTESPNHRIYKSTVKLRCGVQVACQFPTNNIVSPLQSKTPFTSRTVHDAIITAEMPNPCMLSDRFSI